MCKCKYAKSESIKPVGMDKRAECEWVRLVYFTVSAQEQKMLPMEKKSGSLLVNVSGQSASEKCRGHLVPAQRREATGGAKKSAKTQRRQTSAGPKWGGWLANCGSQETPTPIWTQERLRCDATASSSAKKTKFTIASPAPHRLPPQANARLYDYYRRQ